MNKLKKLIYKNKKIQEAAVSIVRKEHILANPNLYFECPKRKQNPKVALRKEHLGNCQVLPCREDLLKQMPKNAICAEVGVAEGYFSEQILQICNPEKLYMIEYGKNYCENLRKKFAAEIHKGKIEILEGDSVEMLRSLPDNILDFVYLDATHDYKHPAMELCVCKDKVQGGGHIMGHDYTRFSLWEAQQYGVVEAVNEFVVSNNYEMRYITLDMLSSNSSYALVCKK